MEDSRFHVVEKRESSFLLIEVIEERELIRKNGKINIHIKRAYS
jgi:hypothetical protein